jgi:predicted DNA-binding transcriptional regulator YafY
VPRNDQITRQWHLLRRLENTRGLTLSQLVEAVPDDYPKNARTVRRDLEALEAVGFPLVTDHHNGQTRWRLIFRNVLGARHRSELNLEPVRQVWNNEFLTAFKPAPAIDTSKMMLHPYGFHSRVL